MIITSDDFGVSPAVNEAVEQTHLRGMLTAASLMVTGDAVDDAIERARRLPQLGVGLHLVLVDGCPVLPPEQVPDLVAPSGRFRDDMVGSAIAMFFRPAARRQLHAEIEAQFAAFAATGLPLDHVNAHKHFHLHPTIASTILKVGRRYGMKAIRAPIEPRAILSKIEPIKGFDIAAPWAKLLRRRLRRAGLVVPDQVFGLAWSGHMTAERIRGLIDHLPEGLTELYAHPATGPYPGSAEGYDYAGELAALTDEVALAALMRERIVRGSFAAFAARTMPPEGARP